MSGTYGAHWPSINHTPKAPRFLSGWFEVFYPVMVNAERLHSGCERFGPGRLPKADDHAIGAGYAAATAAVVAVILFAVLATWISSIGLDAAPYANIVIAILALPFTIVAAFALGVIGWTASTPRSPSHGVLAGLFGAIATYVVLLPMVGIPLTLLEVHAGQSALRTIAFSWGVIYVAFLETWWVTLPVGSICGYVYVSVVSRCE